MNNNEYYKILKKYKDEIEELKNTIYVGNITHSNMMENQNNLILFIKDHNLLYEFYEYEKKIKQDKLKK